MIGRLYIEYLTRVKDPVIIRQSVDQISEAGLAFNNPRALNALYENLHTLHEAKSGQPELSNYIQGMMEKVEQRLSAMK